MKNLTISRKLTYSDIGWIPANRIKPHNNHTIVLLVEFDDDDTLIEKIGRYENEKFEIDDRYENSKFIVHYWFPIPSIC